METEFKNSSASAEIVCGACEQPNHAEAKFCGGCGHAMFEPCFKCSSSVLLTQRYCVDCGADLVKALQKKQQQFEQWMNDAMAEAKNHHFDAAIGLMQRIEKSADYRLAKEAQQAGEAIEKIRQLKSKLTTSSDDVQNQANKAFEQHDHPKVIELLQRVPDNLLSDQSRSQQGQSIAFMDELSALNDAIQQAVKQSDWVLLGALVNQVLVLVPENTNYRKVADQVAQRLINEASAAMTVHDYASASEMLQSVPDVAQNDDFAALREKIEELCWYSVQLDREPFATAMLGRLAVRFSKESPDHQHVKQLLKDLSVAVKQQPPHRHAFAPWSAPQTTWVGGDVGILAAPQSIQCGEQPELRQHRAQLSVAFGLAIQGLGRSRVSEGLLSNKKSVLSALSRRKQSSAWGIDIGSTALRAVRLELDDDEIVLADVQVIPFESPICREIGRSQDLAIGDAITAFLNEKESDLVSVPVWINLSASEVVSRNVVLPPVPDKQADKMLDMEIVSRIPLNKEDLELVRWIAPLSDGGESIGRPAMICAARKSVIQRRLDLCNQAGLTVNGLQCDSVALVNFAAHEFDDLFGQESDADETVAIVDVGAATLNVVIASGRDHKIATFQYGGEELTSLLARSTNKTLGDADTLKRNPAAIQKPVEMFAPLENRMDVIRSRLKKSLTPIQKELEDSDRSISQTWCVGGGCLCHSWIRRVLLKSK